MHTNCCKYCCVTPTLFIIVFIFTVISTTFRLICPPAFRRLSNSGTFTELRTTSFIESTGVACSDSVSYNRVQVFLYCYSPAVRIEPVTARWLSSKKLSEPTPITVTPCVLLDTWRNDSKFREGSRVRQTPEEGRRTYRPKRCGNNNKDEDNNPKTLNDKNHQASSQKFRQLIHSWMVKQFYLTHR